jgi:two-component system sensor histidine kinase ChvG
VKRQTGRVDGGPRTRQRALWWLSRIGVRLMLFNVLLVFLPVAGILYLDVYETRLLQAQERAMVQQARLLAAALGGAGRIDEGRARALLQRLDVDDARLQVHDGSGVVVADSARHARRPTTRDDRAAGTASPQADVRDAWLYRLGARLASVRERLVRWLPLASRTMPPGYDKAAEDGGMASPELRRALGGRYGAATRPTPGQRSLTLSVAVPVSDGEATTGAVVVSQSTYRILQALYDVRLQVFRVVVASLTAAVVISALVTLTIVRPIRRLRRTALALADDRRLAPGGFPGTARRDEVGDLARALDQLSQRLHAQVALLEAFTADVAHEFRNPLAAVRSAADVLEDASSDEERRHFVSRIRRDVERLDRLVVGAREIARVGSALHQGEAGVTDLAALVRDVVDGSFGQHGVVVTANGEGWHVRGHPDRLRQVLDNVLTNATSFSPESGSVAVMLERDAGAVRVRVSDRGPGIPAEHLERVFERFFSYRPHVPAARQRHVGLGLAIARAIIDDCGGTIVAANREGGGAVVTMRLPGASSPRPGTSPGGIET